MSRTLAERKKSLQDSVNKINREYAKVNKLGPEARPRVQFASQMPAAKIYSTGNPAIDRAIGGGFMECRVYQLSGTEGAGKSTQGLMACKTIQDASQKLIVLYSTEDYPEKALSLLNMDREYIIYIDARKHGEDGMNILEKLLTESKMGFEDIGIIMLDSVADLAPAAEADSVEKNGYEGATMGRHAAMMSKLMRQIYGRGLLNNGTILLLINQERTQIGSTPLPSIATGGLATRYGVKVNIKLNKRSSNLIKEGDNVIGHTVDFEVTKNNSGMGYPHTKSSYSVYYGKGLDILGPIIEEASDYGIIKGTSWKQVFKFLPGEQKTELLKIQGEAKLRAALEADPTIKEVIEAQIELIRERLRLTGARYQPRDGGYLDSVTGEVVDMLEVIQNPIDTSLTPNGVLPTMEDLQKEANALAVSLEKEEEEEESLTSKTPEESDEDLMLEE